MTYALVTAEPMPEQSRLPDSATTLADPGVWVTGLQFQSVEVQQSTGWYQVVTTARPADTATHTYVRSLTLNNGVPTETWTQRPWTAEELLERERPGKVATLATRLRNFLPAIAARKTAIAADRTNATLASYVQLGPLATGATLAANVTRTQQQDAALKALIPIVGRILDAQNGIATFAQEQIHLDGLIINELADLLDGPLP